jgi:hypothetical protein
VNFKKQTLPEVDERVSLSLVVITWFLFLLYAPPELNCLPAQLFLLVPSLWALVLAFTEIVPGKAVKVGIYLWFLLLVFIFAAYQLLYDIFSLPELGAFSPESFGIVLFAGMAYMRAASYGHILLGLFSCPPKSIRKNVEGLAEKYGNYQMPRAHALLLVVGMGGALALNHFLGAIPDILMVSICFLAPLHFWSAPKPRKAEKG